MEGRNSDTATCEPQEDNKKQRFLFVMITIMHVLKTVPEIMTPASDNFVLAITHITLIC